MGSASPTVRTPAAAAAGRAPILAVMAAFAGHHRGPDPASSRWPSVAWCGRRVSEYLDGPVVAGRLVPIDSGWYYADRRSPATSTPRAAVLRSRSSRPTR